MREVLDRLQETMTALDNQLHDLYFTPDTAARFRALELLWKAKRDLWYARMHMVDAFAGHQTPVPKKGRVADMDAAAAAYKRGVERGP